MKSSSVIEQNGLFRKNAPTARSRGFTLIEILVVVAVIGILVGVSFLSFSNFHKREALEKDTAKVVAVYEEARALTLGSKDDSVYGVHAEEVSVTRFKGSTYSSTGADNVEETLSRYVRISSISLSSGGADVVFSKIGGTTTATGTLTLSPVSSSSPTKTITIYTSGLVEVTD